MLNNCDYCGATETIHDVDNYPSSLSIMGDGKIICDRCRTDHYSPCDDCGKGIKFGDETAYWNNSAHWCLCAECALNEQFPTK